jgi:polyhydroxyalkanoate synthesis regulator phasin
MTTFTTEDRQKAEDKEDLEQMLREQIHAQQAEIQRLKRKIRELEDND